MKLNIKFRHKFILLWTEGMPGQQQQILAEGKRVLGEMFGTVGHFEIQGET